MKDFVSPRQVARAMGMSESSLKRWCDRGVLSFVKTAGGHRRIAVAAVLDFLRRTGRPLIRPELLGLPIPTSTPSSSSRTQSRLVAALIDGDAEQSRRLIIDQWMTQQPIASIFDDIIAPALRDIGALWECGELHVHQEHRGCEIVMRVVAELGRLLPLESASAPLAIGGAIADDPYVLPTTMAEIVFRDAGWRAASFGVNLPWSTWRPMLRQHRPRAVWVAVSALADPIGLPARLADLASAAGEIDAMVFAGGRGLIPNLFDSSGVIVHCHSMSELADYARVHRVPLDSAAHSTNGNGHA